MILKYFSIWQDDVRALRLTEHDGMRSVTRFMPETDSLETNDIETFVEGMLHGSIKDEPWLPDLSNSTFHRAKVVVQENFDEVVFDKTKAILVLFYSPWCTLCYHLTLDYDWLANKLYKKQTNEVERDKDENEEKEFDEEVYDDINKDVDEEQKEKEGDKKRE
ncbi:hypothetical protein MRX96_021746 [Rhipicephalus microplus]